MIGEGRSALQSATRTIIGRGDLHRSVGFIWTPKPERADPAKVQKPSDMACSRFPNTIFSCDLFQFGIQASLLWSEKWGRRSWSGRGESRSAWPWSGQLRSGFLRLILKSSKLVRPSEASCKSQVAAGHVAFWHTTPKWGWRLSSSAPKLQRFSITASSRCNDTPETKLLGKICESS